MNHQVFSKVSGFSDDYYQSKHRDKYVFQNIK